MNSDNLRMLIGFALIMLILIIWQIFLPGNRQTKHQPPVLSPPVESTTAIVPTEYEKITPPPVELPETTFTLENDYLLLKVTSLAGAITSCSLKKYGVQLLPLGQTILGTEEISTTPLRGFVQSGSSVTLRYYAPNCTVIKTWTLGKEYTLGLVITVQPEGSNLTFDALAGIATTESNVKEDLANFHFYARNGNRVHQLAAGNLRKKPFVTSADWAGLKSKYFFLALVNSNGKFDSVWAKQLPDDRIGMKASLLGTQKENRFLTYLGPIEYNRLRSFHLGFENVVSLGWLKPVALAILYLLRLFYLLVKNWGLAIVLFSALMKGIFYPLTRTQTRQMRQLQLLQPKIEELKKKYKDAPQMLNQETMRLYQLYRVNPLSGCLPLLVQMPVFFALYAVLRNFIELRGANFILWLDDLSQPDTLFGQIPKEIPLIGGFAIGLLPIMMGASFIAQNLLTATDKRNWAMSIIFPIFITAIFLNLSSGLQLYWFIYNLLSIGESLIVTKGGTLWQKFRKKPNLGRS